MKSYGLILSGASETAGPLVSGNFPTRANAVARAEVICRAQPGVEYEVVRRASAEDSWQAASSQSVRQVIDRRWA